jgi:hypothetical protein
VEQTEDEEQDEDGVDDSESLSSCVDEEVKLEPKPAAVEAASNANVEQARTVVEKSSLLEEDESHADDHRPLQNPAEPHSSNNVMIPARPPA